MRLTVFAFTLIVLSIHPSFAADVKDRFFELDSQKQKFGTCTSTFKSMFGKQKIISVTEKSPCKKNSIGSVYYKHQDGDLRPMNPLK